jgi:hypothetical protein
MPNKDIYHDVVVHALVKAGWEILRQQHYISVGTSLTNQRRLFIDIKAQHASREIIVLIEVKSLENSPVHELMEMIGQYVVYRTALDFLNDSTPLYMAIPEKAYHEIITHPLGEQSLQVIPVQLLIYEPEQEELRQWIPEP